MKKKENDDNTNTAVFVLPSIDQKDAFMKTMESIENAIKNAMKK